MQDTHDTKAKLQKQIHAGRRQKLRARFAADGLEHFNECEVLEFALGFCVPRVDTNPAAHSLIEHFGTLDAVVNANPADLMTVYGIGEQAAAFIHFLKAVTIYLAQHRAEQGKIITPDHAVEHLKSLMGSYAEERFLVACLDQAGNIIKVHTITNHELDMVHVNVREIIAVVTATKTAQVVLAHNHLNENPLPSAADMQLTRRLLITFQNLGMKLLDHLIFAGNNHYSFHCSGLLEILKEGMPKEVKLFSEDTSQIKAHKSPMINKPTNISKNRT